MKKIISTLLVLMLVSLVITGCSNQTAEPGTNDDATSDITESIDEAESVDTELSQEEIDTDLSNLEQDLLDW